MWSTLSVCDGECGQRVCVDASVQYPFVQCGSFVLYLQTQNKFQADFWMRSTFGVDQQIAFRATLNVFRKLFILVPCCLFTVILSSLFYNISAYKRQRRLLSYAISVWNAT